MVTILLLDRIRSAIGFFCQSQQNYEKVQGFYDKRQKEKCENQRNYLLALKEDTQQELTLLNRKLEAEKKDVEKLEKRRVHRFSTTPRRRQKPGIPLAFYKGQP